MNLQPVTQNDEHIGLLYKLLEEREPDTNISHKSMPTMEEHTAFVQSNPYLVWYFIVGNDRQVYGAIYLTRIREIGIHLFKQYQSKGIAKTAIEMLIKRHPGRFLANINPVNNKSIRLFEGFGFKHIQNTYEL